LHQFNVVYNLPNSHDETFHSSTLHNFATIRVLHAKTYYSVSQKNAPTLKRHNSKL